MSDDLILDWGSLASYLTTLKINPLVKYRMPPDRLSVTLGALADPTRRAILARLAAGETTVLELARPFRMSLPAVSKHLRVLERAGLVSRGRNAQFRPVKLQAAPLKEVVDWAERYRQFWDASFDRLERYLREVQDAGDDTRADASPAREP